MYGIFLEILSGAAGPPHAHPMTTHAQGGEAAGRGRGLADKFALVHNPSRTNTDLRLFGRYRTVSGHDTHRHGLDNVERQQRSDVAPRPSITHRWAAEGTADHCATTGLERDGKAPLATTHNTQKEVVVPRVHSRALMGQQLVLPAPHDSLQK
eukprot:3066459-Prymnesium_polylepis.1